MIKMIVTNQQIINSGKNVRIGRKLASSTYKRNTPEYRVKHDTFPCQLQKKRIMPKPYQ